MSTVLFNRETLKVSGVDREVYPYEVQIKNVDLQGLTKEVSYTVAEEKKDEEGNQLYLLPQEPKIVSSEVAVVTETAEVTDQPIMIVTSERVPLLNEDGTQKEYEVTAIGEVTEDTGEPIMVTIEDEETDEVEQVQKTDKEGNLLFYGQVGTGLFNKCWVVEETEVQKTDKEGNELFYKEATEIVETVVEQPNLEITEDHEAWEEDLPKALEGIQRFQTVTFEERPEVFSYQELASFKEKQLRKGLLKTAKLFESMEGVFSTELSGFRADLGFDFISLPTEGEARTVKIALDKPTSEVGVVVDSSLPVKIELGATASDLQELDRNNERFFESEIDSVYVKFTNTTDKRLDIFSFAIVSA